MSKISTLIFDFGDVFINLDKDGAMENALRLFKVNAFDEAMLNINIEYETGKISTSHFINFYTEKFPYLNENDIIEAWNYILRDFPKYRLDFIQKLASDAKYRLILLSNTNHLHIEYIKTHVPFYEDFKACFYQFYLSQEIHLRKPNTDIFQFVLQENNIIAQNCLFIDDTKANTDTAKEMGFNVWNIDETKEDVIHLFEINHHLF